MASPLSSFVVAKEYHVLKQLLQESDRIQDLYRLNSAKKVNRSSDNDHSNRAQQQHQQPKRGSTRSNDEGKEKQKTSRRSNENLDRPKSSATNRNRNDHDDGNNNNNSTKLSSRNNSNNNNNNNSKSSPHRTTVLVVRSCVGMAAKEGINEKNVKNVMEELLKNYRSKLPCYKTIDMGGSSLPKRGVGDVFSYILEKIKNQGRFITKFVLSFCEISDLGVKCIADYMKHHRHITLLNLAGNNITDKGAMILADTLLDRDNNNNNSSSSNSNSNRKNTAATTSPSSPLALRKLNLSRNSISEKGMEVLASALKKLATAGASSLEEVDLTLNPGCLLRTYNFFKSKAIVYLNEASGSIEMRKRATRAIKAVREELFRSLKYNTDTTTTTNNFNINSNNSNETEHSVTLYGSLFDTDQEIFFIALIKAMAKTRSGASLQLAELRFKDSVIDTGIIQALHVWFVNNHNFPLASLVFDNSTFDSDAAQGALATLLKNNTSLKKLAFVGLKYPQLTLEAIAKALDKNAARGGGQLREFSISDNPHADLRAIVPLIRRCRQLRTLSLTNNHKDEWVPSIALALVRSKSLRSLELRGNNISNHSLSLLLYKLMKRPYPLESLDLRNNNITAIHAADVDGIKASLLDLKLQGNQIIYPDSYFALLDKLENNQRRAWFRKRVGDDTADDDEQKHQHRRERHQQLLELRQLEEQEQEEQDHESQVLQEDEEEEGEDKAHNENDDGDDDEGSSSSSSRSSNTVYRMTSKIASEIAPEIWCSIVLPYLGTNTAWWTFASVCRAWFQYMLDQQAAWKIKCAEYGFISRPHMHLSRPLRLQDYESLFKERLAILSSAIVPSKTCPKNAAQYQQYLQQQQQQQRQQQQQQEGNPTQEKHGSNSNGTVDLIIIDDFSFCLRSSGRSYNRGIVCMNSFKRGVLGDLETIDLKQLPCEFNNYDLARLPLCIEVGGGAAVVRLELTHGGAFVSYSVCHDHTATATTTTTTTTTTTIATINGGEGAGGSTGTDTAATAAGPPDVRPSRFRVSTDQYTAAWESFKAKLRAASQSFIYGLRVAAHDYQEESSE